MKELRGDCDGDVVEWGSEHARHADEDGSRLGYQVWTAETSRVVSGPIGPAGANAIRGTRFPDRDAARAHWAAKATVVEEYSLPGRWAFRILKR